VVIPYAVLAHIALLLNLPNEWCWVESGVNALCGWAQILLVLYLPSETPSLKT